MRLQETTVQIQKLLATFVAEVNVSVEMGRYDVNVLSETVLIPLLSEVLDLPALENLNMTRGKNFPGVDLGDVEKRVAIQVTSDPSSAKVKDALKMFVRHRLYEDFDRFLVYVITEKQKSYTGSGFSEIIGNSFDFDKHRDILDYKDIARITGSFQNDRATRVREILEANFGSGRTPLSSHRPEQTETLYSNLIDVRFPDTLYVGTLNVERSTVLEAAKERGERVRRWPNERDIARLALTVRDLRFSVDYEAHAGQVVTFHNLSDDNPLAKIVDQGTVVALSPEEYYGVSVDFKRVFKSLLRRCLQQLLYQVGVQWQEEDHLFIFVAEDDEEVRREKWIGKQKVDRKVFERTMKNNKPDEILNCYHLAFRADFVQFGSTWYLRVKPEHFFSRDGYRRSAYGADNIRWRKKKERNEQVFNHLRFFFYYLLHGRGEPTLFTSNPRRPYPFLSFGPLATVGGAPHLDDKIWLAAEDEMELMRLDDPEGSPPLFLQVERPS